MQAPISRARYVQENRQMRFKEALQGRTGGRLTQAEAAMLLGQCERSFRRPAEAASPCQPHPEPVRGPLERRLMF